MKKRSFARFCARLEEIGLREEVETRAKKLHVSLRQLYEGEALAPSVAEARKRIYTWLIDKAGKGQNEVARLFDRAPSGISKLLGRR